MHEMPRYFDRIVDSFGKAAARPYVPQFSVQDTRRGLKIFDKGREIAFLLTDGCYALDLWSFSPFEPDVYANAEMHPYVWDLHTCRNSWVNLPYHLAEDLLEGVADPSACMELSVAATGPELRFLIRGRFQEGQRLEYEIALRYAPEWGRYRCFVSADAWKLSQAGFEPINFMMCGALRGRSKSRWSHSVYEDMHGQLRRLVHSNALFFATDYACPIGTWRSKGVPLTKAWVAYALNEDCNPAMLVHECNVPMYVATCSQLFDEHLIWRPAALEQLDGNYFHFRMHTEFVNLGRDLAATLLEGAADPPAPERWRIRRTALPFHLEQVNDFETPVDVWQEEDCPIFAVEDDPAAPVQWADDEAYSGSRSLRLKGKVWHGWTEIHPCGAVCEVELGARYRLSGWLKTTGVERFARLELASIEYTYANKIDIAHSAKVSGDSDWTHVSVTFDNHEGAYVQPMLQLYGLGTAWFDDLMLEKVSDSMP